MAIHFPIQADIPLRNPPLTEVVCQVRFPPILSIGNEVPIRFQERVRSRFPEFDVQQQFFMLLPDAGAAVEPGPGKKSTIYRFQSGDNQDAISLAVNFFAHTTKRYQHWSHFASNLTFVHEAVQEVYQPSYATRIGLRYINRLTLANTGTNSLGELLALVRPELTALLTTNAWLEPEEALSQLLLEDGTAKLTLRSGYSHDDSGHSFLLDFDYYEEGQLELAGLLARCDHYHDRIYSAFRWCILDSSLPRFGAGHLGVS